jgi:hypothetical protein
MKLSLRLSVLILTCASVVAAQTKAQETPAKTQEAPKTQETTPTPPATQTTVTESKAPVAGHPVASPKEVKNLYIEPMVNDLVSEGGVLETTGGSYRDCAETRGRRCRDDWNRRVAQWNSPGSHWTRGGADSIKRQPAMGL